MVQEHDALISSYEHLADRARAPEALHTLRRISTMVKPLMRARGWRVGILCEFYPDQTNLLGLNWNRGQKICLRLRHPGDASQFLRFEDVLDTMLHELAHIEVGPHNPAFHAMWDRLRDELEALVRKGYTGEGFMSKGRRLGGAGVPVDEIRRQHRAAVREQQQAAGGAGGGVGAGRRLGGRRVRRDEDIRQVIADAADDRRRAAITRGCASGAQDSEAIVSQASANGFRTQAEEDAANEKAIMDAVMDLIEQEERERLGDAYVPPSSSKTGGLAASSSNDDSSATYLPPPYPPPVPLATKPTRTTVSSATASASRPTPPLRSTESTGWSCPVCTLHNQAGHLACDACGSERPSDISAADYRDDTSLIDLDRLAAEARRQPTALQDMADSVDMPPPRRLTSSANAGSSSGVPKKRPAARPGDQVESSVLRPRSSATKLAKVYEPPKDRPLGWNCKNCGSFMETEWWTCSMCGRMKEAS